MFSRKLDVPQQPTAHGEKLPILKRVMVGSGVIDHITQIATSESIGPCDTLDPNHTHPTMWEIYVLLRGHATFTVGGKIYNANEGDTVVVPPKTTHSYRVADSEVLELLYFGVATDDVSRKENATTSSLSAEALVSRH